MITASEPIFIVVCLFFVRENLTAALVFIEIKAKKPG